jgi:hypothetical protein
MAGTAGMFHAIRLIEDGEATFLGTTGLSDTLKETNVTGRKVISRRFKLEPGESLGAWNQLSDPDFVFWSLRILEEAGVLRCWVYIDNPTSSSNVVASGVDPKWLPWPNISCQAPLVLTTIDIQNNPVDADFLGVDANGLPTIESDAGTVAGKVYRVRVKNISADAVTGEIVVIE